LILSVGQLDRFASKEVGDMFRYFNCCGFFGEGATAANGIDFDLVAKLIPNPTQPEQWVADQLAKGTIKPGGRGMGLGMTISATCNIL
jgi:hypothetical protein